MLGSHRSISPDKVAIYIRWSTEDQGEGTTLEVQRDGCSHFLKSQGWQVNDALIFVDDGYSGGSLERPALTRLRRVIKERQVDCVVVYKIDRLSRNVVDTVNLVLREWENRCHLKSAREAIDTLDHAGKMFFYTLVSFAEWERNTIRDRTMSGRLRRAQEGRNPGRKLPYGYTTGEKRGEVVVVPAYAEIVRRIFRDYVAGSSARGIAMRLNADGIPGPGGKGWSLPTVARLLSNETYTGKLTWGTVSRQPDNRPEGTPRVIANEKPWVVLEEAFPAIVSKEEFALAQAVKRGRPNPSKGEGGGRALASSYLLSGIMVCGLCGATMRARPPYDKSHAMYFCQNRFHGGPAACDSSHIRQKDLDAIVATELKSRYGAAEERSRFICEYLASMGSEVITVETSVREVAKKLGGLTDQEAYVRKLLREQAISLPEYRHMLGDIETEGSALREQEKALSIRLSDLRATVGAQSYLLDAARKVDHWDQLDAREKKSVLRFFVERVKAFKPPKSDEVQCEIVWRSKEEAM